MHIINDGDLIFIVYDHRRKWLRRVELGKQFHCDRGYLNYEDIVGKEYGETHLLLPHHNKVALLPALPSNIILHMKRQSQIIYPEDLGLILSLSKIRPNSKILEAGTGSGTVSSILAMYSRPNGHVNTFDIREIALKQARKNIAQMGVADNVSADFGNILEDDFDFKNIDFIMLDLATTWLAIPRIKKYLSPTGRVCLFSPTLEQVKKNFRDLGIHGFHNIHSYEMLKRNFQVKPNATRPRGQMVGHTGYVTFATFDEKSLVAPEYTAYYSPENIGNLLIYGGIRPETQTILVCSEESGLPQILKDYYEKTENLHVLSVPAQLKENSIEALFKVFTEESGELQVDSIILDNIESPIIIEKIQGFLKNGGILCALSRYIENVKVIFDQLKQNRY
ncbi:MAG: tRNA (adenine-N1)-methyltransferase, partial [Promethearchaeota archaeon]